MVISDKKKSWNDTIVAKNIARSPERMEKFQTTSNIEMERCFTPGFDYPGYEEQLGFPGEYTLYSLRHALCYRDTLTPPMLQQAQHERRK